MKSCFQCLKDETETEFGERKNRCLECSKENQRKLKGKIEPYYPHTHTGNVTNDLYLFVE